jgi:hypothetical protein
MTQVTYDNGTGIRISRGLLEDVCKRMIEIILFCLPDAFRGTIYSVGPMPNLRVIRVATGRKDDVSSKITWDALNPSDYDPPGKIWDTYRDRPDSTLEAMAWCVERQKSWTSDDPENNIRSVRKQLEGKAGEDFHHMEPVLVRKADLWNKIPPMSAFPEDSSGKPIWEDSPYATVAVIKIHFFPRTIKQGDRSTRVIKELSRSLGTEMLSLHARELAIEKEKKLVFERQETSDALAHEFRNLVPKIGFAYRAINNEIGYLRETWENLIEEHVPAKYSKKTMLEQLDTLLDKVAMQNTSTDSLNEISTLKEYQKYLAKSFLLPQQNEMWLRRRIRPLWLSILSQTEVSKSNSEKIHQLLDQLKQSFHSPLNQEFIDKIKIIPNERKQKWIDLAYREMNRANNGIISDYIEFLESVDLELPRKRTSLKNFDCLKVLVELIPEIEEKLNHRLEELKNSRS